MDREKVSWKRTFTLCVAMFFCMLVLTGRQSYAANVQSSGTEETYIATETYREETAEEDNDELFAGYLEELFYASDEETEETVSESTGVTSITNRSLYFGKMADPGTSGILSDFGSTYLTDINLDVYTALKTAVEKIASGEETSSVVTVSLSYTTSELGATSFYGAIEVYKETFSLNSVMLYLTYDCPYEMYWYDKTAGVTVDEQASGNNTKINLTLTFTFSVAAGYQGSDSTTVDSTKAAAAVQAAANAKAIVEAYADESDRTKLAAYRDEICALVSYCSSYSSESYGDVWQLVYVFDGDDSTEVVCEGYSKAFQYLCDLSEFNNVVCYTVSGTMIGGTGSGAHMWNVVRINGVAYLADLTNSDTGTVGQNGGLFLVCADEATANSASGYSFVASSKTITYVYSSDILAMYADGELTLGYSADEEVDGPVITVQPTDMEVTAGEKATFTLTAEGDGLSYKWYYKKATSTTWGSWPQDTNALRVTANSTWEGMQVYCVVTDENGYTATSDVIIVTVATDPIVITVQPTDMEVTAGEKATFNVRAEGNGLSYQWFYKKSGSSTWGSWPQDTNSLRVTANSTWEGMQVYCLITDEDGNELTSNTITVTLASEEEPIVITVQPTDMEVTAGEKATFNIRAEGNGLSYKWYYKKAGADSYSSWPQDTKSLRVTANSTWEGMQVYCIITDEDGNTLQSDVITVTVAE